MNVKPSIFSLIIIALSFLGGSYFYKSCLTKPQKEAQIESSVIVEKIEKVMKIVNVEGHYSEMIKYDNSTFNFPGFRKKALVQVNGRVLVGYNLNNYKMKYDAKNKTIDILNFPAPEIIALETNTRYFDLEQGLFSTFSKDELSRIESESKKIIKNKALSDHLFKAAEEQMDDILTTFLEPYISAGWNIRINGKNFTNPSITIKE